MVGLYGIVVAVVLWLATVASPAAAQSTGREIPKTRVEFEKVLLERAKPDSLATDTAGAWHNVYRYLAPARFLDRSLYERALQQLAATDGGGCEATTEGPARLACAARNAATAASSLTLFAESVLLHRDAVAFAESVADSDPEPLVDTLLALADDEWITGALGEAEATVRRVAGLMADRPGLATSERRMRVLALQARLADARLDDTAAVAALSELVDAELAKGGQAAAAYDHLSPLLIEHLRGRFCAKCGQPVAAPVQRWLTATLARMPDRMALLMILSAPQGTVPAASAQAYARRYLASRPANEIAAIRALMPRGGGELATAHMLMLSYLLEGGPPIFAPERPRLAILRGADRQPRAMKTFLEDVANDNFGQFGADSSLPGAFEEAAWHFESGGLRGAARLTLDYVVEWQKKRQVYFSTTGEVVDPRAVRQARVFALTRARLAALQLAAGERVAAARNLDAAGAIAQAKLREAWELGGERAILTIRDLSEALGLVAQTRHTLLAPRGFAENPSGADALFRAMQAAITGETALTLEVARQRRILGAPQLAELRRAHVRAAAETARLADIEGRYAEFNYDGAITLARREAEAQRDRLAAELGKEPAPLAARADIEPVPLAEAQASLASGEAIVLLRVGNQSLDGLLLDRDGRSLVWRTAIRRDALEALVKSLRAGADMATGRIPDFKVDDAVRLHEAIFGPVSARLSAYRKLIVLGEGPLQSLPYGILLTRKVEQAPRAAREYRAAALPWLVRSHAVALAPSVRSLVTQRSGALASRAGRPFLGIGNPQLASAGAGARSIDVTSVFTASSAGFADLAVLRGLASLPETEDELRQIASVLKASAEDIIVGRAASEVTVKALPLDQYRMIAFATHGVIAGELAGTSEPGLVLTPPSKATREDDGFLSLSEIAGLRLDADLIILSACNTGTSDGRPRAESLSGLARGFFNAGARSLLVTHWTIPSDSAVRSTTGLVAARSRDPRMDWADALREATLAIIDQEGPVEWAHPTFWGAYVAIGVLPLQ